MGVVTDSVYAAYVGVMFSGEKSHRDRDPRREQLVVTLTCEGVHNPIFQGRSFGKS